MIARIMLVEDGVFGGLMSEAGPGESRRPMDYLDRLPLMMALLQLRKGALPFDDEAARLDFESRVGPSMEAFDGYVDRIEGLERRFGVRPVWSSLEAPLAEDARARQALGAVRGAVDAHAEADAATDWNGFVRMYSETLKGPRGKFGLFDKWTAPPVGLMALSEARSLDDLPDTLNRLRDTFGPIRRRLHDLQREKAALLAGESDLDDRGWREAERIDAVLREAFAAFAKEAEARRKTPEVWGVDWVLSIPRLIGAFKSLGLGTVTGLLSFVDPRRRIFLGAVTNFRRSLGVMSRFDDANLVDLLSRHLGADHRMMGFQPTMLRLAADKSAILHECLDGEAPPDEDALIITWEDENGPQSSELPHRTMWLRMLGDDALRTGFLHPHTDGQG